MDLWLRTWSLLRSWGQSLALPLLFWLVFTSPSPRAQPGQAGWVLRQALDCSMGLSPDPLLQRCRGSLSRQRHDHNTSCLLDLKVKETFSCVSREALGQPLEGAVEVHSQAWVRAELEPTKSKKGCRFSRRWHKSVTHKVLPRPTVSPPSQKPESPGALQPGLDGWVKDC